MNYHCKYILTLILVGLSNIATSKAVQIQPLGIGQSGSAYYQSGDTIASDTDTNTLVTAMQWGSNSNWLGGTNDDGMQRLGAINNAESATFLGTSPTNPNIGWVLTDSHVTTTGGNFNLGGQTYNYAGSVYPNMTNYVNGTSEITSDLTLFSIFTTSTTGFSLSMPLLTIANPSDLVNFSTPIVMTGNGGVNNSWGINTLTVASQLTTIGSLVNFTLETDHWSGNPRYDNAVLVGGDSGGGDYIYNSLAGSWELAGLNVGVDGYGDSYRTDLSKYRDEITAITGVTPILVPEPSTVTLLLLGGSLILLTVKTKTKNRS